ncbi:DUF2500 domain-containing protein [Paenibacillus sp. FSL W8-0186]|uniref:DUF2500 domain-containing protein n=1 Tax=Paenibacillus woosongensis TaxID=307580 RepID=A0ABQ4MWU0_9BACL|nr:DUF2500 domain-containing protein [Paenibacillus woosongensis]GIP60377.1 hypothetical protein J15TS10_41910 [Paenibacillus woosongensis]
MSDFGFSPMGGDPFFNTISTLFPIIFIIIFGIIIAVFISNGVKYVQNKRSPQESVFATVVSKRTYVEHHSSHHADDHMHSSTSRTHYYITLQFDNGGRKEYLDVKNLYGLVAEGDTGYALVQGEWIVAFERSMERSRERAY